MKMRLVKSAVYNPGDNTKVSEEVKLSDINFNIFRFTNRPKPDPSKVVIISAFSEFGCESLIPLYCIPNLLQNKYKGYYSIVIGWYGREYLYKHLVDEYWELKEEFQFLREYCRAFHHTSKNLKYLEKKLKSQGVVVDGNSLGQIMCYPQIVDCGIVRSGVKCGGRISTFNGSQQCSKCGGSFPAIGLFNDCINTVKKAKWVPLPSKEKMDIAKLELPDNPVGITARGRKCYGRNLTSEFYERLIWLLEDMGYNPVWLGEPVTTLPCPCKRIVDFRENEKSRDLEQTLAYVANMKFTIQFWTASTRLAGLVGTPYILFESPDQIWGHGQEGMRLHLTSKSDKKLVIAHFKSVVENNTKALNVVRKAVNEVENKDFSTIMGMVENEDVVRSMIWSKRNSITWF